MSRHEGNEYIWFREPSLNGVSICYLCDRVIYHGVSKYQTIDIVETRLHGKMLFLDGVAQSAERDEFIYHELLVHPAMFAHPNPEKVLVIGGAEGATLREVLKHQTVKRAVLVDIDGELVEICKQYLPGWHQGSFDDPRVEVVIGDGRDYVVKCNEKFDVIIIDQRSLSFSKEWPYGSWMCGHSGRRSKPSRTYPSRPYSQYTAGSLSCCKTLCLQYA